MSLQKVWVGGEGWDWGFIEGRDEQKKKLSDSWTWKDDFVGENFVEAKPQAL